LQPANLKEKFGVFSGQWNLRIIAEFIIVQREVEHLPVADDQEARILLIEPKSTLNTCNITNERTVAQLERI